MSAYRQKYPLPSQNVSAGGNVVVDLAGLPDDARLTAILLEIAGTFTSASTDQAVTLADSAVLLQTADLDSDFFFLRGTGRLLVALEHLMTGRKFGTLLTATTGGVAGRATIVIPLADPTAIKPNDCAVPVRLIQDRTLNIGFKSALTLGTTDEVTVSSATLKPTAILAPDNGDTIPSKSRINYEDWAQATAMLKPGHFSHLGIYEEAMAVTLAEIAQVSLSLDGQPIVDRTYTTQLVADFNRVRCSDAASMLSYQPSASQFFIPVLAPEDKYQATNLPRAENSARADIDSGTQSTARWFYRQVVPAEPAIEASAIRKLGFEPETALMQSKTESKSQLGGSPKRVYRNARLLPKRIYRA